MVSDSTIKIVTVVSGIVVLEAVALFNGIDGVLLTSVIATLAAIGGFTVNDLVKTKGGK